MSSEPANLNIPRGLAGAAIGAAAVVVLSAVMVLAFFACRWSIMGATRIERGDDMAEASLLPDQVAYLAVIAACAGWATAAPRGRHRFATSLLIVFLFTLGMWEGITSLGLKPQRYKMEKDGIRMSEVVYICLPPIIAAAALTVVRIRGESRSTAKPDM